MDYLTCNPAKRSGATELLAWLIQHGKGDTPQATLLRGAADRLAIALRGLDALPVVH